MRGFIEVTAKGKPVLVNVGDIKVVSIDKDRGTYLLFGADREVLLVAETYKEVTQKIREAV